MRIGLVDVDGHHFPNFALMKIAAYHRAKGDNVEMATPLFGEYDRVYQSKIFTFTPDKNDFDNHCEVVRGGTGYDIKSRLPEEIEKSTLMDYSIYPPPVRFFHTILFSRLHTAMSVLFSPGERGIYPPGRACAT